MECYACENPATGQCRRCARVYCELHGGELCAECLSPVSALPSFNLYRGSLLALLVGTAVALWLLVQPPGQGDSGDVVIAGLTPTDILTDVPSTATEATTGTPTADTTLTPEAATTTPTAATATPTARTYTVKSGDTLSSIADEFAPQDITPYDYARQIASANGLSVDDVITPGQTLVLP